MVKRNEFTKTEVGSHRDASDSNPFKELAANAMSVLTLPHIYPSKLRNGIETKIDNAILTEHAGLKSNEKYSFNYGIPPSAASMIRISETYIGENMQSPVPTTPLQEDDGEASFHCHVMKILLCD